MRSKVPVAYEVSVGVLGLLGKAWKNTREVGETFFTGKQYSKDTLKKVASEVQAVDQEFENTVRERARAEFDTEVGSGNYDFFEGRRKEYNSYNQEQKNFVDNSEGGQLVRPFWEKIDQLHTKIADQMFKERANALTPQKRELFEAYKVSQTDPVWKQTGNPNVRISGFTGLRLRDVGKPGQGTEDLLSVSAITAGAVVGYSALSHFAGDEE